MVDKSLLTQEMKAGLFSAESLSVTVKNEQRGEEIKKTAEQVIPEEERKADVVHPSTWAETVGRKYDHQEKSFVERVRSDKTQGTSRGGAKEL